ncbi:MULTISPECIES: outer membrane lipoprotein-sorting protein [unclassified Oceanispirochaeta]|uniref:outer membrane lipoprotein-sorting protein n=1 Tax=unclassified Oceanispirochaeta TaxID=2635722 RepID=UPI000E08F7C0|nr:MULTISPECIES: outer membrane lipoprotein-sorting protein [unclassified Oceanispirochaeta]MBF9014407.1 outer membrane lipoprotein-sorting protein [Oceanispirochaeta sp. M2]NPD71293.1 outer membrane lipoprotein-sorting protein [Oceanispirochaeta sp. M1]RDG33674.1 outer membrane lipoprotein-sorting protein [Oceanispirochaeta sp. M1]
MKSVYSILFMLFIMVPGLWAEDYQVILEKVDALASYMDTDFAAEYTIVEDKPGEDREKTVAIVFRRDADEKYVIVIMEPQVSKGQGYLKVEDALWFYDPESRRFNFSSSKDRFQNTNARNSDFTRSTLANDYDVTGAETVKLGRYDCWKLHLEANNDGVTYPIMDVWVDEDYLVRKTEDYGLSGELLRTTAFPSYQMVEGRYIPHKFLLLETLSREKTQISINKVSFRDIPNTTFSKQFLEQVNR